MAVRQLIIERPPQQGKKAPVSVRVSVDDQAQIGPWVTTLAARLGYPLVDSFGAPIAYRLRSVSARELLPLTGRFADARFSSGSRFVLEPDNYSTVPMLESHRAVGKPTSGPTIPPRFSRRFLMSSGILTAFSVLGFSSGVTTAFAQHLLSQRSMATAPIMVRQTFTQHQQTVRTLAWAPDEGMVASGGNDELVFVWKMNGSVLRSLQFNAPVGALAWSPDGQEIVVGAANTVSFFDTRTGLLLAENATSHTAPVTSLGWTTQTSIPLAVSAGTDKRAIVWNGQSHQPQVVFRLHTAAIEALAVLTDTVATASLGGVTRVWSATSGQELHGYYSDAQQSLRTVAFSSLGMLATGSDDGGVHLWNDGRTCAQQIQDTFGLHCVDGATHLQAHTRSVRALAFSPDGSLLATGGDDKKLIIWSVQKKTPVLIQEQQDALAALAWSPSGQFLAGAIGPQVAIWQIHL